VKHSRPHGSPARSALGVYGISVTSELSGLDPQTLRLYERRGLLTPARTEGGTRRYSDDDLSRLRRITELTTNGVNLAGIAHILELQDRNTALQADNAHLEAHNTQLAVGVSQTARDDAASAPRQKTHPSNR
jgi:MerR family transcriptional regulator/heat shock protein HspR